MTDEEFTVALLGHSVVAYNEDKFITITIHDQERKTGGWGTMSIALKNGWRGEERGKAPPDRVLRIHSEDAFIKLFDTLMNIKGDRNG